MLMEMTLSMLTFNNVAGTSLVVQWLRFCAPSTRGSTLIPGWGTRFRMPQQSKIPCATTKTWYSQIFKNLAVTTVSEAMLMV